MSTTEPNAADLRAAVIKHFINAVDKWHRKTYNGCPLPVYLYFELEQSLQSEPPSQVSAKFQNDPWHNHRLSPANRKPPTPEQQALYDRLLQNVREWHQRLFTTAIPPYVIDQIESRLSRQCNVYEATAEVMSDALTIVGASTNLPQEWVSQQLHILFYAVYNTEALQEAYWSHYHNLIDNAFRGTFSTEEISVLVEFARTLMQNVSNFTPRLEVMNILGQVAEAYRGGVGQFWEVLEDVIGAEPNLHEADYDDVMQSALYAAPIKRKYR